MLAYLLMMVAANPALNQPLWERFESSWGNLTRVELRTPGGPLPFVVELATAVDDELYVYRREIEIPYPFLGARIHNGGDPLYVAPPTGAPGGMGGENSRGTWNFAEYDSRMEGKGPAGCVFFGTLAELMREGTWTKQRGDSASQVPFVMRTIESIDDRFDPIPDAADPAAFAGRWAVDFSSTNDPAVGVFEVDEDQIATGTFLTPTGDYRYLAGRVDGDLMRLSTFDGAHAFLFHARMQPDGSIAGDFWSGNWHHETWTAVRDDNAALPDAFGETTPTGAGVDDLAFRDLDGTPTRVADLLDAGDAPARILYLFGSWCPNCADAGAEMKRLKEKYGERLTIVGLAFEQTEDFPRSARQVGLYAERHGADWPVLIAGLADKAKASAELPVLDRVRAYPTTIFLNAANEIMAVHTGFNGPATGEEHRRQQRAFEKVIDGLIAP